MSSAALTPYSLFAPRVARRCPSLFETSIKAYIASQAIRQSSSESGPSQRPNRALPAMQL